MLTFSETVLNITIWFLASAGFFFGLRATLRKRRNRRTPVSGRGLTEKEAASRCDKPGHGRTP
jgi:hypothetical protein